MYDPIIVVGFGNNGTRVACWYVEAFGIHMMHHNAHMDWHPAGEFGRKWFWESFNGQRSRDKLILDFKEMVLKNVPDEVMEKPWGFKMAVGMGMFILLYDILPFAKIVHVMRNPVDVSGDFKMHWASRKPRAWGEGDVLKLIPQTCKSLTDRYFYIWLKFNYMCSEYFEAKMPDNYLRVRLEDLVLNKDESITRFSDFLNRKLTDSRKIDGLDTNRVQDKPIDMDFVKEWFQRLDKGQQKQFKPILEPTLEKFGYI